MSLDSLPGGAPYQIVQWEGKYATGIELIDTQHKKLVDLTNELYQACLSRDASIEAMFKEAMSRMVEYVRYHFSAEQDLLQRINYPEYHDHKKQHDTLVKQILDAAKGYNEGKKFVPNNFVRSLKDWVFGHIAVSDKIYSGYIHEQIKKGLLTEEQLKA